MTDYFKEPMDTLDWAGLSHFAPSEFSAPEKMSRGFLMWLDGVRARAGVPMHVSSSYRTPEHNAEVSGAANSAHCDEVCCAADIEMSPTPSDPHWDHARFCIIRAAIEAGGVRIGLYPNGSLHLDRTEDQRPAEVCWVAVAHRA